MNTPRRLAACITLATVITGCYGALNGSAASVPISDFFGAKPAVQIEWPTMTLTVPTNYPSSLAYISPRVRVEKGNILVVGRYVLSKKPAKTVFNLKKLGMKEEQLDGAAAFWVDPDGTKQPIPVERTGTKH